MFFKETTKTFKIFNFPIVKLQIGLCAFRQALGKLQINST